jgi:hypothetical protein
MATDWSGHKTFLQKDSWLPLKYKMVKIPDERVDDRIFMKNSMWANVESRDFKAGLEKLYKKKKTYKENCMKTRDKILRKFSQKSIEILYNDFMEELG